MIARQAILSQLVLRLGATLARRCTGLISDGAVTLIVLRAPHPHSVGPSKVSSRLSWNHFSRPALGSRYFLR